MGLFSRHAEPEPVVEEPPRHSHSLFGSKHSHSPTRTSTASTTTTHSSTSPDRRSSTGGTGLLHRSFGHGSRHGPEMDPSIVQARERLVGAERAEKAADQALMAARESAREAREHVRLLEVEAKEEARRAKIKEHHAREFSKRGKLLGH
ncbi:uncharacterized protein C8A04DRAFT_32355 [Dichotomopilus funicola]|uniref:Uncharacterized protein n=1 Tax=Dichotomopilus funicola TaxID=1934379 RepID=A0AAN6UWC0_9PEZI|nr:hypothetical protein C8A04DRAFT_32355 [Dichotomopilus funicola]